MTRLRIDEPFVLEWSGRYVQGMRADEAKLEGRLFSGLSTRCRKRGSLTHLDLLTIGRWKSPRALHLLEQNEAGRVQEVTALAFAPDASERASTLMALLGVGEPMASAILTVWDPLRHTVFDWRATETLKEAGLLAVGRGRVTFGLYLALCRRLADHLDLPNPEISKLRMLDRALWKYSAMSPS